VSVSSVVVTVGLGFIILTSLKSFVLVNMDTFPLKLGSLNFIQIIYRNVVPTAQQTNCIFIVKTTWLTV
jgi:hypothetical protein